MLVRSTWITIHVGSRARTRGVGETIPNQVTLFMLALRGVTCGVSNHDALRRNHENHEPNDPCQCLLLPGVSLLLVIDDVAASPRSRNLGEVASAEKLVALRNQVF